MMMDALTAMKDAHEALQDSGAGEHYRYVEIAIATLRAAIEAESSRNLGQSMTTRSNGMDGATAFDLIDRHADGVTQTESEMTRDKIVSSAKEYVDCLLFPLDSQDHLHWYASKLEEAFIAGASLACEAARDEARKEALELCAKICDSLWMGTGTDCATRIRIEAKYLPIQPPAFEPTHRTAKELRGAVTSTLQASKVEGR